MLSGFILLPSKPTFRLLTVWGNGTPLQESSRESGNNDSQGEQTDSKPDLLRAVPGPAAPFLLHDPVAQPDVLKSQGSHRK